MNTNMDVKWFSATYSSSSRFKALGMVNKLYGKHGLFKYLRCAVVAFCTRRVASFKVSDEQFLKTIDIQMIEKLGSALPERSVLPVEPTSYQHPVLRIKSMESGAFPVLESVLGEGLDLFELPESWGSFFCRWFYALRSKVLSLSMNLGIRPCFSGRKDTPRMSNVFFFPVENSKVGFDVKKKMIAAAEKSVVLSGNYCGGNSFDEILDIFISKFQGGEKVKILLLSSSKFFTESNKSKIDCLSKNYPELFQIILTDDCFMYSDNLKKITNHTKGLVVDGKYSVMGGSGIEDKYAYDEGVGDRCRNEVSHVGFLGYILPRGFRDMDFGFVGSQFAINLQEQLLNLGRIWQIYNRGGNASTDKDVTTLLLDELKSECKTKNDSTYRLAKEDLEKIGFRGGVAIGFAWLYCSGPEQSSSDFYEEIKRRVRAAEKRIYIDHMYFHCPEELKRLLAEKVNSGVQLTIVTNGNEEYSPKGHKAFGPRNRAEIKSLLTLIKPECMDNISVYEFGQKEDYLPRNTTLHKKVMVVDDYVLAGSSNLGYKSMVSCSDHEINFVAKSMELAERTIKIIQDDAFKILRRPKVNVTEDTAKPLSKKLDLSKFRVTTKERFVSFMHRKNAWLIG